MMRLKVFLFMLLCANASATEVHLNWRYKGVPAELQVFQQKAGSKALLWDMGEADKLELAPVGALLNEGRFDAAPGSRKRLVLIYHNTTKSELQFFAAPHQMLPAESSLGFKFKCLCVNHVYKVAPGKWWWRVVELRVDESADAKTLEIVHDVIKVEGKAKMDEDDGHRMDE
jgi:hypothetical protein